MSGSKKARFSATGFLPVPKLREMLLELKELLESGKLKSVIYKSYPLDQVPEAHAYADTGHKRGNIIMTI